jgi:hypothetical protein
LIAVIGDAMKKRSCAFLLGALAVALCASGQANSRNWQKGTLVESERSRVQEGSTKNTTTDGNVNNNGDKANYSGNSTTTTTANYETYQTYTIDSGQKIYVGREHLLFPWSKPASTTVGEPVKFAVEKGKLYVMGDDGKEHKTTLVKESLKTAQ